jgi:hypothetical protein
LQSTDPSILIHPKSVTSQELRIVLRILPGFIPSQVQKLLEFKEMRPTRNPC